MTAAIDRALVAQAARRVRLIRADLDAGFAGSGQATAQELRRAEQDLTVLLEGARWDWHLRTAQARGPVVVQLGLDGSETLVDLYEDDDDLDPEAA